VHDGFEVGEVVELHVVLFWENVAGGVAFSIDVYEMPNYFMISQDYADGIEIGDPFDGTGVEFGFASPQVGFNSTPIRVMTFRLLRTGRPCGTPSVDMAMLPHANYDEVIIADRYSSLFTAEPRHLLVIPSDKTSWGEVKALYR